MIADRLGWFSEGGSWDVTELLKEKGENVRVVTDGSIMELTLADIAGGARDAELAAARDADVADDGGRDGGGGRQ